MNRHTELKTKFLEKMCSMDAGRTALSQLVYRHDLIEALQLLEELAQNTFKTAYKKDPSGKPLYAVLMRCPECDGDSELITEREQIDEPGTVDHSCIVRTRRCERCELVFDTYEAPLRWLNTKIDKDVKQAIDVHIGLELDNEY
jgi:hypothetical protein